MAKRDARWRRLALALALVGLGGCAHVPALTGELAIGTDSSDGRKAADVQFALGRAMEKQGDVAQALTAYQEAMRRDPSRADAALHAAALLDQQGKFVESEECYRKAEAARPGSADVACNHGYSLYVQQRWDEAEAALRQALTRQPDHRRAHNNLGLVLARTGRSEEALSEFRRAGLDEADAHVNLAFALTLQEAWPQARAEYAQALAADPSSAPAKKGLEELNAAQARLAVPAPESRPTAQ